MKIRKQFVPTTLLLAGLTRLAPAEALIDSWHTADSGRYARIWATQAQETPSSAPQPVEEVLMARGGRSRWNAR